MKNIHKIKVGKLGWKQSGIWSCRDGDNTKMDFDEI
jgi:hypothetical protein